MIHRTSQARINREIYNNAFTMYALLQEMSKRCVDPVFKSGAIKILEDIDWAARQ